MQTLVLKFDFLVLEFTQYNLKAHSSTLKVLNLTYTAESHDIDILLSVIQVLSFRLIIIRHNQKAVTMEKWLL